MKYLNEVVCKDNLELLKELPSESVDLVYIDPPFFTQRNFKNKEGVGFEDKWDCKYHYIQWMQERVIEIERILKDTGSIFLHCDWRTSHHMRFMLEEVFGEKNFVNEVIWHYTGGGRSKKYFSRKHDSLFWYSKIKGNQTFNIDAIRVPYSKTSSFANSEGVRSKAGKLYRPNPLGTPVDSVWGIPFINNMAKERLGYPTQKPEALLERIIKACSNEGDIIADFFCGSGTTLAVAKKLGRNYIGCDSNPGAVRITKERLYGIATG